MKRSMRWLRCWVVCCAVMAGSWPAAAAASPEVLLYVARGGAVEATRALWRTLLGRSGSPWREIRSLRDPAAQAAGATLIVAVEGGELRPSEQRALLAWPRQGTAVLLSGRPGPRTGAAALRRLFGVPMRPLVSPADLHVVALGHTALTDGLPAGTRMFASSGPFWVPAQAGRWRPAAEFTDWSYRPPGDEPAPAILYGEQRGMRWVYVGVELRDLAPSETEALTPLLRRALEWLAPAPRSAHAAAPRVHLADWPDGFRSAQLVEMDTELDDRRDPLHLDRALVLGRWVAAVGARASFYCVTGDLALRPDVLATLAAQGHELGLHGERHDPFGRLPADLQAQRVRAMWSQWQGLRSSAAVAAETGFRAPYEVYDDATERALAQQAIGYHVSDAPSAPHRLPYFVEVGAGRRLLRLPRSQPDDHWFFGQHLDAPTVRRQLSVDAQSAHRIGALGLLSLHPQYFAEDSPVRAALPDWLAALPRGSGGVWLAAGGEIAAWWQRRSDVVWTADTEGVHLSVPQGPPGQRLTLIVDTDLSGRTVHSSAPSLIDVVAVRPWPDADGPVWQSAIDLQVNGAGGAAHLAW